jgi:hypothetical protein
MRSLHLPRRDHRARRLRRHAPRRRGVLLLVVLSILVLFLLLGTTFLISSSQYRSASRAVEKASRATFQADDTLERALMQLVRDTNNAHSAARHHSLLRDMYGADGFLGRTLASATGVTVPPGIVLLPPSFSGATAPLPLGPTQGQMVDFFVIDNPGPTTTSTLGDYNVTGLDFDANGLPLDHALSQNDAYYEGCLLTMLDGPCRGQSVRVIDYDFLGFVTVTPTGPGGAATNVPVSRVRVMAPSRLDGRSLQPVAGVLNELRQSDTVGYRFLVNGRAFNGTGVGFNAWANPGGPRLSTLEALRDAANPGSILDYIELALAPNTTAHAAALVDGTNNLFANVSTTNVPNYRQLTPNLYSAAGYAGPGDSDEGYDAPDFQNMVLGQQPPEPRARARVVRPGNGASVDPELYYPNPRTPALRLDLEGLPIPSFHRPALANYWVHRLMASAWLRTALGQNPSNRQTAAEAEVAARAVLNPVGSGLPANVVTQLIAVKRKFMLRPLREDHPAFDGSNPNSRYAGTRATPASTGLVNNFTSDTTFDLTFPAWETSGPWDVDNDGDGVPDSVWIDMGLPVQKTEDGRFFKPLVAVLVEDLDGRLNLNAHGSEEHFASVELDRSNNGSSLIRQNLAQDLANPRPLRTSNQLPHGEGWGPADISLRSILSPQLPVNLPGFVGNSQYDDYSRLLVGRPAPSVAGRRVAQAVDVPVTWGRWGSFPSSPAALPLYRPGVSFDSSIPPVGNRVATLDTLAAYSFSGWPQFSPTVSQTLLAQLNTTDPRRQNLLLMGVGSANGFGELPDLKGRYATGLSVLGQAVVEAERDGMTFGAPPVVNLAAVPAPLTADSPYEIDLSPAGRGRSAEDVATIVASYTSGAAPVNDDSPFTPAELERVLRATDADAQRLPSRLWDTVDAFDPQKLVVQNAIAAPATELNRIADPTNFAVSFEPTSQQRVVAQSQSAINRRSVTTDSWDAPVPNENWTARCLLGADGLPGVPFVDDDGDGQIDEGDEVIVGFNPTGLSHTFSNGTVRTYAQLRTDGCDDFVVYMLADPPSGARVTNYLRYRVTLELTRQGVAVTPDRLNNILFGRNDINAAAARADRISYGGLLAPEVLAGRKMNLNRPFGDGKDSGDGRDGNSSGAIDDAAEIGTDPFMNGVVDEPGEAGEPYVDTNQNGRWNPGEPFVDRNGDGAFNASLDRLWESDANASGVLNPGEYAEFDHTNGQNIVGPYRDPQMARQLYARHLYCLMLAVMDENYLAPYDPNDPQVAHYLDPTSQGGEAWRIARAIAGGAAPTPAQQSEARRRAMRKLTCRQVAQWAVNCADMRDPDSIQTAFEYDENPWDGWNVTNGANVFPLDGDCSTDENYAMVRDLTAVGLPVSAPTPTAIAATLQTRGVVWGAERPELLITEGMAWHNRRAQDRKVPNSGSTTDNPDNLDATTETDDGGLVSEGDDDLDQQVKPEGGALVELHNPWSIDAYRPAELYTTSTAGGPFSFTQGVPLNRVSNARAVRRTPSGTPVRVDTRGYLVPTGGTPIAATPSPVWRMAVVEEHPAIRNDTGTGNPGAVDDLTIGLTAAPKRAMAPPGGGFSPPGPLDLPSAYVKAAGARVTRPTGGFGGASALSAPVAFVHADPDFPAFDSASPRWDRLPTISDPLTGPRLAESRSLSRDVAGSAQSFTRHSLIVPPAYVERAFYFTYDPLNLHPRPAIGRDLGSPRPQVGSVRDVIQPGLTVPFLAYDIVGPGPETGKLRTALTTTFTDELGDSSALNDPTNPTNFQPQLLAAARGLEFVTVPNPSGFTSATGVRVHANRYIAIDEVTYTGGQALDGSRLPDDRWAASSTAIAPILPGRYAVLAPSGLVFPDDDNAKKQNPPAAEMVNRHALVLSWPESLSANGGKNDTHPATQSQSGIFDPNDPTTRSDTSYTGLRRVELIPSTNPNQHQVVFRFNGGLMGGPRLTDTYTIANAMVNVTDHLLSPMSRPNGTGANQIAPAIAVPIEGFSLSTPVDDYYIRQAELDQTADQPLALRVTPDAPEGRFVSPAAGGAQASAGLFAYDEPFDLQPELIANQTTPNYRTVHLQRLANPLLAWNPPPVRPDGSIDGEHDATRPVNPYLTIDSMGVDVTSYNGASTKEAGRPGNASQLRGAAFPANERTIGGDPAQLHRRKRQQHTVSSLAGATGGVNTWFQSRERGLLLDAQGVPPNANGYTLPRRDLFGQQRSTVAQDFTRLKSLFDSAQPMATSQRNTSPDNAINFPRALAPAAFDQSLMHSFGFAGRGMLSLYQANGTLENVDINGDGVQRDLIGAPAVGTNANEANVPPALHWPNRPFISEGELLQVPCWSSSRLLTYYSTFNPTLASQPNQYDGAALVTGGATPGPAANIGAADPVNTNRERWRRTQSTFGHLLNFFASAPLPARSVPQGSDVTAYGAPHFYRILDYVHTPSRFVATDKLLNPSQFGAGAVAPNDPRRELLAPFNRVDEYREPGKVNLNTVVGRRDVPQSNPRSAWSEVYDGVMHRVRDGNRVLGGTLQQMGHGGPAWRDLVASRRGYRDRSIAAATPDTSASSLHRDVPTEAGNPFRDAAQGDNVPLASMVRNGVEVGRLRPHPYSPGIDGSWGARTNDDNGDSLLGDPGEAGVAGDDGAFFEPATGLSVSAINQPVQNQLLPAPLLSAASLEPSLDTERNPQFRYSPIARLANLTSQRSGAYAIWITVGYFEVTPVNAVDHPVIWARYGLGVPDGVDPVQLELTRQFQRVYQDGYTLGQELGIETGENRRRRGFYLVDRTLPVGFKPGDDVNVDNAVLLRRRIE